MGILRAKTIDLIETKPLTELRKKNSTLNIEKLRNKAKYYSHILED